MFDELSEIGAYELYFDGIETYSLHFTDLMRSGEIFQGDHLPSIIETAVKYAHNPKWLNEKIATPKKYITQSKRRPTKRALDGASALCPHGRPRNELCEPCGRVPDPSPRQ